MRIQRGGEAGFVAGMHHRDADRAQRQGAVGQRSAGTIGQAHFRQAGARVFDALAGCDHVDRAVDRQHAVQVRAATGEADASGRRVPFDRLYLHRQRVADAHRRVETQRLLQAGGAGAGQARAQHGGDQRRAPHAVADHAVEAGRGDECRIQPPRIAVAVEGRQQLHVLGGQRPFDRRAVADGDLVERAVAYQRRGDVGHGRVHSFCSGRYLQRLAWLRSRRKTEAGADSVQPSPPTH